MEESEAGPAKKRKLTEDEEQTGDNSLGATADSLQSVAPSASASVKNDDGGAAATTVLEQTVPEQKRVVPSTEDDDEFLDEPLDIDVSHPAYSAGYAVRRERRIKDIHDYSDEELESLWTRLSKSNKLLLFKQFIRLNPTLIASMYELADRDSNIITVIGNKFRKFDDTIRRVTSPDLETLREKEIKTEGQDVNTHSRLDYYKKLESRTENVQLNACVAEVLKFWSDTLLLAMDYFESGKVHPAAMIVSTLVNSFVNSSVIKCGYLTDTEESDLCVTLLKSVQSYLETEDIAPLRQKILERLSSSLSTLRNCAKNKDVAERLEKQINGINDILSRSV